MEGAPHFNFSQRTPTFASRSNTTQRCRRPWLHGDSLAPPPYPQAGPAPQPSASARPATRPAALTAPSAAPGSSGTGSGARRGDAAGQAPSHASRPAPQPPLTASPRPGSLWPPRRLRRLKYPPGPPRARAVANERARSGRLEGLGAGPDAGYGRGLPQKVGGACSKRGGA